MKRIITLILCVALGYGMAMAQGKKNKEKDNDNFKKVIELVEGGKFTIDINKVLPNGNMDLSRFNPRGEINVCDTTIKGNLPFFGRAYRVSPGSDGGIRFDGTPIRSEWKIIQKRKHAIVDYQFTIREADDVLRFTIEIGTNSNCSVTLNSNNRQTISYLGVIKPLKSK
ncbi:MAG: DUF4251 domain-containing protein [Marinifilaceae bacterium]